ncbi:hypothetical protein CY35_01G079500 [Sphagnum magellanicum]|nr:hypothetical protein CY35_01G079500 [Sphagnum magellanicum]
MASLAPVTRPTPAFFFYANNSSRVLHSSTSQVDGILFPYSRKLSWKRASISSFSHRREARTTVASAAIERRDSSYSPPRFRLCRPNMSHTSIMVDYFQLILESIKEVQKFISQGSLDDWNSKKKFLRINKSQCEYLASELEEIQTYLELQSHVSRHIKHGVTMKHLYHMVKKAEMLVMECCSEKWLLKAVALMDSKENFVEIVLELQWWKNMVHIAILEIQETRTSSLLLQLQDADKAYEDFLNQRLHILEKELLEDKQMLVTKLEQVTSRRLTHDTLELQKYLLHRLGRTGQSRDCATHSPFSWRPSQFKNGVHVNLDADALGYHNTATVVKVRWLMGQEFILKVIRQGVQEKDAMVAKASEATILSKIQHPHVVQLMCYWDNWNNQILNTYLLMEKMAGDISRLMARQTTKETKKTLPFSPCKQSIHPFSFLEAIQIMLQVAKAMCFLHSKEVAHRDLKCRNILWKREPFDNHLYVKLADFGEAKTNVRNSTTDQQQTWMVGTTGWRAPELSGEHMLTHKRYPLMVDVFSFGMTFFEVLTGQAPFQAEKLRTNVQTRIDRGERPDLPKTCPPFLAFLIHSCWDGNPNARPTFPQICRMLLHGQNLILGMTWYDEDVKSKLFSYTSLDGIKKELKVMPVADRLK